MSIQTSLKRTSVWIWLLSGGIVLGSVYWDAQDISPGELANSHAQEIRLLGAEGCSACHGDEQHSMTDACLTCHKDIHSQINVKNGLHGLLATELVSECATCHSEHHGPDFLMTNYRSFQLAGFEKPEEFGHTGLDFHLTGEHLKLACDACHKSAFNESLQKGEKRFLGLNQECATCHDDVHQGAYGTECASCHGQHGPFEEVAEFDHTKFFPLVGSHDQLNCSECHQQETALSVETLLQRARGESSHPIAVRSCAECHKSPHSEGFINLVSQSLQVAPDQSCQHCHSALHESFSGHHETFDKILHNCSGFPLTAPHDNVSCKTCHVGFGNEKPEPIEFRSAYPGREADNCRACHGDPHNGQFEEGAFRGSDCLVCHDWHQFQPSAFSVAQHNLTQFPLHGSHANLDCDQCHKLPAPEATFATTGVSSRIFRGTPTECSHCHDDPHQGEFQEGPFGGNDCRMCHNEHSFAHSDFTIEQHAQTHFPLTGAHMAVGCNACHPRDNSQAVASDAVANVGEEPAVPHFNSTPTQCKSCHEDVHQGAFDRPGLPDVIEGRVGCARCHSTESFDTLRDITFDHALWTGYPLLGAHGRAQCSACHSPRANAGVEAGGYTQALGRNCQDCHSDPHAGQFGPTAQTDCTRCHVEGNSFSELIFNHQKDSQFVLDKNHAKLPCAACHRPVRLRDGRTAIHYKPLGSECGDCHVPTGPRAPAKTQLPSELRKGQR